MPHGVEAFLVRSVAENLSDKDFTQAKQTKFASSPGMLQAYHVS